MFDGEGPRDRSGWMTVAGTLRSSPSSQTTAFGNKRRSTDVGNAEVDP
jgi:hypothetical protein